ncbi:hypothetical protein [Nonomuraea insulae]|uniref:Uncharacterized protein n=1 Tax=Nonomuraea insulae TaxID=1616787 RepID=A0ABW1DDD1_9ACTN
MWDVVNCESVSPGQEITQRFLAGRLLSPAEVPSAGNGNGLHVDVQVDEVVSER